MAEVVRSFRFSTLIACLLFVYSPARADAAIRFNIPSQPMAVALATVANLSNLNILFDSKLVDNLRAPALHAELTPEEALAILFSGTQLRAVRVNEHTLTIVSKIKSERLASAQDAGAGSAFDSRIAGFRAGDADGGVSSGDESHAQAGGSDARAGVNRTLQTGREYKQGDQDEVIVTAEKRSERLQDVPVPVSAINAERLTDNNQLRLQDYYSTIPGLDVASVRPSYQVLTIRGVSTGPGNPTVGVVVDDIPYGSSTNLGGALLVPDIDPGDLARVEVLRGPQGTFYGASSLGGLLKFVTIDPSTDRLSGRVQVGASGVHGGDQVGYNVRASANIPITDSLAIRASAFTRQDPGYIDNPVLNISGINRQRVNGGRISGLWKPTDDITVKLSALYERTMGDGANDVDVQAGLGDLQQNYIRGVGKNDRKAQAYSATVTAGLGGGATLTSVSGYSNNAFTDSLDYSFSFGPSSVTQFGTPGAVLTQDNNTKKFTQELRLSVPFGDSVEWLLGAFYTHEKSHYEDNIFAEDPPTGTIVGQWVNITFPSTYQEYAGFTDLTFHFTDRFDVQIGGRESHIEQKSSETDTGAAYDSLFLFMPSPVIFPETKSTANAFTYLVTPRFKVSPDMMVYARLASGYRAGGPNAAPGVPREYAPDKTKNYEVGAKGSFLDKRISFDASLYYIDWRNIQLSLFDPTSFQSYFGNGSKAKSQGLELSIDTRPITGLNVAAWIAWGEAKLTDGFPVTSYAFGRSGDRLPFSSRISGNFSVEQSFPLWGDVTGFVGGAISYVGQREGLFGSAFAVNPSRRQNFPGYAKTDLRTGINFDTWMANLYINNIADIRGATAGGLGSPPPFAFTYIQPRTVGLSVAKKF